MRVKFFNGYYRQGRELSVWLWFGTTVIGFRVGAWFRFGKVKPNITPLNSRYYFGPFGLEIQRYLKWMG